MNLECQLADRAGRVRINYVQDFGQPLVAVLSRDAQTLALLQGQAGERIRSSRTDSRF